MCIYTYELNRFPHLHGQSCILETLIMSKILSTPMLQPVVCLKDDGLFVLQISLMSLIITIMLCPKIYTATGVTPWPTSTHKESK